MVKHCRRKHRFPAALPALAVCLFFAACGPRYDDAAELARQGRTLAAAGEYSKFALAKPKDSRAPGALLKAAQLYAKNLGLCTQAQPLLERLARSYPEFKIPEADFRTIFVCPDYFPPGAWRAWTYGDSQTFGKNARQVVVVTAINAGAFDARYSLYAGKTLVSRLQRGYYFSGLEFHERQGGFDAVILSYPLEKGKIWQSRAQEGRLEFTVEASGLKVKVKGGEFENCVKVRRRMAGQSSWVVEYYAPWIGKVATAVAGKDFENRVMELLSYEEKK